MPAKIKADLTQTELHDLWDRLHRVQEKTKTVTVPKEALNHLLLDYQRLFRLFDHGYDTVPDILPDGVEGTNAAPEVVAHG